MMMIVSASPDSCAEYVGIVAIVVTELELIDVERVHSSHF